MSFMAEDCVSKPLQAQTSAAPGMQAVSRASGFAEVWAAFPDAHWSNARHFVGGDRGVSEWTFTGTRADGTRDEVNGCDLFTFEDGKIALKNSYRKNRPPLGGPKRELRTPNASVGHACLGAA